MDPIDTWWRLSLVLLGSLTRMHSVWTWLAYMKALNGYTPLTKYLQTDLVVFCVHNGGGT